MKQWHEYLITAAAAHSIEMASGLDYDQLNHRQSMANKDQNYRSVSDLLNHLDVFLHSASSSVIASLSGWRE